MDHYYSFTCSCENCREETRLREECVDKDLAWFRANGPLKAPPTLPKHSYSNACGCGSCFVETAGQRVRWDEAVALCIRHGGDGLAACDLCVDQVCGADHDDPMLRPIGELLAASVKRNCSAPKG